MPVRALFTFHSVPEIEAGVLGLGGQGYVQMAQKRLPPLYGGSIRYVRERPGREIWQSARVVAERGVGDCEDLCAYRVAELRMQGVAAFAVVKIISPTLRHVQVTYRDPATGRRVTEDPSKRLGM